MSTTENLNKIGLKKSDYAGAASTLCTGCGHDLISNHIITACFEEGIAPHQIGKMSGIGCSSKLPAYFMSGSFAVNSMHGRMAPVATGAIVAQPRLKYIGISGDGDTASIGMGGFVHLIRRNVPIVYIVADNGVYGLTKGQFSATAEKKSVLKSGAANQFEAIDLCTMALELGCGFVARSFSGDAKQMVSVLREALNHPGIAFIDVISPCITFNNHEGSTKSYSYVKTHDVPLKEADTEAIKSDRSLALKALREAKDQGQILTGLFYQEKTENLVQSLKMTDSSMAELQEKDLKLKPAELSSILGAYR